MSGVQQIEVAESDSEIRLDRWFHRHFPGLSHGRLQKLLRKGQVRVDGARAKASDRVNAGQIIRVPPIQEEAPNAAAKPARQKLSADEKKFIQSLVLFKNSDLIAINKPAGLAVQGGTKTHRHIDGMLDGLRFGEKERPKLVHRLDRDTSGVLVLARTAKAAATLSAAFRSRRVKKIYWALTKGAPPIRKGIIDVPLIKAASAAQQGREMMMPDLDDQAAARSTKTAYQVVSSIGGEMSWLALQPVTGRTHQLRAHCAAIGNPIIGDHKYGERQAINPDLADQLHLHARRLDINDRKLGNISIVAPLSAHMKKSWGFLGLVEREGDEIELAQEEDPLSQ